MLQLQRFEILKLRLMFKMFLPETNFSGLQVKMLSLYSIRGVVFTIVYQVKRCIFLMM